NHFVQPMICLWTLAWWQMLRNHIPAPRHILGYSVGEIAAHSCAGVFSLGETLELAGLRAELMDLAARENPGALLVLRGLRWNRLEPLVDLHSVELAIAAGSDHFVLGGRRERLEALRVSALTSGAGHARWLPATAATHASLMEPARTAFHGALWNCVFKKATWPRNGPVVLAGIDASPVVDQVTLVQTLSDQLVSTVEWISCLDAAWESGARVFLE